MYSDSPDIVDLSELDDDEGKLNLATAVYQNVWNEFYAWEQDYCQQLITSEFSTPVSERRTSSAFVHEIFSPVEHMDTDEGSMSKSFTLWQYDLVGKSPPTTFQVLCEVITVEEFPPYPRYEACTPTSVTVTHRPREMEDRDMLAFIPYADDRKFRPLKCAKKFEDFAWEIKNEDPDLKVIQLETARRLHFTHGLPIDEIRRLNVLDDLHEETGYDPLRGMFQRDLLRWPGSQLSDLPELSLEDCCAADNLSARVNKMVQSFCPNLNCIESICLTHNSDFPSFDFIKPKVTSSSMISARARKRPCGDDCFRHGSEAELERTFAEMAWSAVEIRTLKDILNITPDLRPCELAVLCRKPCREVFMQRTQIIDDDEIQRRIETRNERRTPRGSGFVSDPDFKSLGPCHHQGACVAPTCNCFTEKQRCQRNCRCGLDCAIRWKGCNCKKGERCSPESCKCLQANRECDPDLCRNCKPKSKKGCRNFRIQQGICPVIEIKVSQYGLGAFATKSYAKGDFVGDYVGEPTIGGGDDERVGMVYRYTGLNYLYQQSKGSNLDSARVGNETRFLNHKPPPANNCDCEVLNVNNDLHIGLFATKKIAKGAELLLDYGSIYWVEPIDSDSSEFDQ